MQELYAQNLEISRAKNSDYCGANNDPFKNFRACELLGISAEQAILVRMSDKLQRIGTLLGAEARVSDESVLDSLSDLSNYSVILRMLIESKHEPII